MDDQISTVNMLLDMVGHILLPSEGSALTVLLNLFSLNRLFQFQVGYRIAHIDEDQLMTMMGQIDSPLASEDWLTMAGFFSFCVYRSAPPDPELFFTRQSTRKSQRRT